MKRILGYTFLELFIVLAMVSLLGAYGLSAWGVYLQHKRLDALTQHLSHAIQTARAEAIARHQPLVLSPWTQWEQGAVLTARHETIGQWQWDAEPFQVRWVGFKQSQAIHFTWDLSASASNGHFSIVLKGVEVKRLNINRIGRVL